MPLHIAFPNAPQTEEPPAPITSTVSSAGAIQRKQAGASKGTTGHDAQGAGAHGGHHGVAAAAGDRAARRASLFSMSHWHKWLAFFLVFAYLVIAKTITRATASAAGGSSR